MRLLFHAVALLFSSVAFAAPLELRVVDMDGKSLAGAVVVLRSMDSLRPVAKPVDAQIDQVSRQVGQHVLREFVPHVLIVPTGSKISFPNSDTVGHQVYSFSSTNRFELDLYSGRKSPPFKVFEKAGVVTLGCNIHDSMSAYIYVVDAQYFGRTDASGAWKLPDVLPGAYTVQVWHPRARDTRPVIDQQIKVTATEPHLELRLSAQLRLRTDSQVPANWDAY